MTFGQHVRILRERRGWSRFRLTLAVKERFRADGVTISETAIEFLETGITAEPRAITRNILITIFPELGQTGIGTNNH